MYMYMHTVYIVDLVIFFFHNLETFKTLYFTLFQTSHVFEYMYSTHVYMYLSKQEKKQNFGI